MGLGVYQPAAACFLRSFWLPRVIGKRYEDAGVGACGAACAWVRANEPEWRRFLTLCGATAGRGDAPQRQGEPAAAAAAASGHSNSGGGGINLTPNPQLAPGMTLGDLLILVFYYTLYGSALVGAGTLVLVIAQGEPPLKALDRTGKQAGGFLMMVMWFVQRKLRRWLATAVYWRSRAKAARRERPEGEAREAALRRRERRRQRRAAREAAAAEEKGAAGGEEN